MRYFQRQSLDRAIQTQLRAKTSVDFTKLTDKQREEIVNKLIDSQKSLCGYCECKISKLHYHIEHFEEQHDAPTKVFCYENLILSCEGNKNPITKPEAISDAIYRKRNISCGHRKAKTQHGGIEIDYALLLNPTDNVSKLFSYADGVIEPSRICTPMQIQQVEYTIKRLNLDAYRLENARINEIEAIEKQLDGLTDDEQKTFIRSLLDETQTSLNPYVSTIKDNFGFILI